MSHFSVLFVGNEEEEGTVLSLTFLVTRLVTAYDHPPLRCVAQYKLFKRIEWGLTASFQFTGSRYRQQLALF